MTLIDRTDGSALWRTDLGDVILAATFDGDNLWAHVERGPDGPDRLVRLDVDTGKVTGQLRLRDTDAVALARVGDAIWIAEPGGTIDEVR